jgi:hypothetical protein
MMNRMISNAVLTRTSAKLGAALTCLAILNAIPERRLNIVFSSNYTMIFSNLVYT